MVRIFAIVTLVFMDLCGFSQLNRTDSSIRSRIYKDVHILASDSMTGRKSGSQGGMKAAAYIAECFRESGLKPAGDSSYFQDFYHDHFNYKWGNILIAAGRSYHYYREFSLISFSSGGKFDGIISEFKSGRSDYKASVVVYDLAGDRSDSVSEQMSLAEIRSVVSKIFEKGAVGILLWDSFGRQYPELFRFKEKDTLPGLVLFLTPSTGKRLIRVQGSHLRAEVEKHVYDPYKIRNVVGYLDNGAKYTVILGAHYDHMGISRRNTIRYGADDNASGTATIMELARYLSNCSDKSHNYLFIAFSGEELGLLGSNYYSEHPTVNLGNISYMFNFDMVGRLGCEGNVVTAVGCASSANWKKIYTEVPHPFFRLKKLRGAPEISDHSGFYKKGIPVVYLTTGLHYDYHTPFDIADRINYDGIVSIIRYSEGFIATAGKKEKIEFRKVPGWYNFTTYWHYMTEQLDYLFTMGSAGAE